MASAITIQNNVHLEKLLTTDPAMEAEIKNALDYILAEARKDVVSDLSSQITNDPKHAVRAVRRTLYDRILGGNLNILRKKRAGRTGNVPASSRGRLKKTEQILGYRGSDRGFILRFLNAGTAPRESSYMNAHLIRNGNRASRGMIPGKDFFGPAAKAAINQVLPILQQKFDEIIQQQIK